MPASWARRAFANLLLFGLTLTLLLSIAGCSRNRNQESGPQQRLFVTEPEKHRVAVYQFGATGDAAPLDVIQETAPDRPVAVAVDLAGSAFVANANGNVRVFTLDPNSGKFHLLKSFEGPNTRMVNPVGIAVNAVGSFYVADLAEGHGRIEWFSGGASEDIPVDKVIEGPRTGIVEPSGVAIDGSGRAFVGDRTSNRVLVFDANASGDTAPLVTIDGLRAPSQIAVDDVLNVYVANAGDNSIAVFSNTGPESWSLSASITNGSIKQPAGVAFDATGRIAVSAPGGVWFFPADAHGRVDLVNNLQDDSPLNPGGIYVH